MSELQALPDGTKYCYGGGSSTTSSCKKRQTCRRFTEWAKQSRPHHEFSYRLCSADWTTFFVEADKDLL